MLTFSRVAVLQGGGALAPMEFATEVTTAVNDAVDMEVSLLMGGPGYPVGTFVWSTIIESRAELAANMAKLTANSKYLEIVGRGQEFATGPAEDRLRQIVHMAGFDPSAGIALGATAVTVTTEIANGQFGPAMEFGVEMADYFNQMTGAPIGFMRSLSGGFGEVQWVSLFDTPADLDRADQLEMTDEGYHQRIDTAGSLFIEGSGVRGFLTRIA